ncbi:NAD(P)-dependent dehydrogenase (short-subunit alcohol dehydrogenase family) [Aquimarina sp. EL_43]|uniref:SDR family NAD(P)-dependent oxidoreductase n=1 Tax=Aquimarina TaxID=290174 RepID=UPI0004723E97|nr:MULTISPECIES: SDR family oxidoreductase [Aquimarina]MBG6130235.1 NAD(P)-dependent dehydrogenase (short-subunit alcohol dehydrogenase family) [Aquimarina sp. EL_35]MBG6149015.1 NAD(P)-dependent dehydrogenase (short-subunit alcohol dehydrogenase family) [Aquimarina sp. EL_32]MBG6168611.1 NAD(P)-dependent dehydrogenase (short-subunit alcohol dehydrogenase family) [Aquimarina sp. EL_43]
MKNKTVIITGASTGIGKEIAKYFIAKESNVVMNSSNEENLKNAYKELGSPSNVIYLVGDISKQETGQKLVSLAIEKFNTVDVLINNAGVFSPKPFLDVEEKDLDQYWNVNLKGTYFTSQAAIPHMIKQQNGSIINIGTVLVDHAIDGFPATAPLASKGAIHALTRQLAAEFGKNNIKVNTIAPGIIRSPLQSKIGIENADSLAGLHLLNRIGEANEIAEAAYYLATSNFVTGETINVAGGHTVGHAI